ncbi:uncharacterized protein LOC141874024 isoform X2 [Acropora palmata]
MAVFFKSYLHQGSIDLSNAVDESSTPVFQRLAFGVGHILNDLVVQLLFSFRLVFFMNVLGLSAENSGWLVLQKQMVHTVMAPLCAILVDRVHIPPASRKLGKKKTWHLLGAILQAVFVPFLFAANYLIRSEDGKTEQMMMIYFGILNVILAFGDIILDISHLSLISMVSKDQMEAVELSALRSAFSYLSGILTFVVAWITFGQDSESQISEDSSKDFMILTAILVTVGFLFAVIFQVGVKEPSSSSRMPLRKLSTFAAANLMRPTSFTPSVGLEEPMPTLATAGLTVARKLSRSLRKASRVSFCDATRWSPTKCDENEEKVDILQSSSLLNNPKSTGEVNKGFYVSVLDLYSDDTSDGTSHIGKETAPTKVSALSVSAVETENVLLSETNSQPVSNSGLNTERKESFHAKKKSRVSFEDKIQCRLEKCDANEGRTLLKEKEPPKVNHQSSSSSSLDDHNSATSVVAERRSVSVLDLYSDDESNNTSCVGKDPASNNVSAVILENKSAPLSETEANGANATEKENRPSRRRAGVSFSDSILGTLTKCDSNKEQTLFNEKDATKDHLQSWSTSPLSSDHPNCPDVVHRLNSESHDTSSVCRDPATVNVSAVSLEIEGASLPENNSNNQQVINSDDNQAAPSRSHRAKKTMRSWLIDPRLYIVSFAYSCPLALQTQAYSYLPLLLIYRLRLSKESIAYLPLIMSISATMSSIFSKKLVQKIGSKLCFIFGAIFVCSAGVMSYFMEPEFSKVMVYPTVILLGFGFSSMLVNSLSFATELIGENKGTSGFVFGCMNLISYVVVGPLFLIIQKFFPEQRGTDCEECGGYLRLVFSLVAFVFSTFGAFLVLSLYCMDRFQGKSSSTSEDSETSK